MKICLVATFPPSGRQLNEYAFYIARELQRNPNVRVTILSDELSDYEFATDADGKSLNAPQQTELPGFDVIRCWKFNSLGTPVRLLNAIRKLKPDVVWFNLVFSSFATPDYPVAAFAGLSTPALTRASGYYTHITLHHVIEHVDFAGAGGVLPVPERDQLFAARRTGQARAQERRTQDVTVHEPSRWPSSARI